MIPDDIQPEPPPVESIDARLERVMASLASRAPADRPPESPADTQDRRHMELLLAGGYPQRAIEAAKVATGPAVIIAQRLLPRMLKDGILLLLGPTGRGKTVMATWFAIQRQKAARGCGIFMTAYSMFSAIKATYSRKPGRGATASAMSPDSTELIAKWCRTPLLVLDEIQTRAETTWEDGLLEEIVNTRYGSMLPVILIANLGAQEASESLGARIVDRANECGGVVKCDWPSYRK